MKGAVIAQRCAHTGRTVCVRVCVGVHSHLHRVQRDMSGVVNIASESINCAAEGVGGSFEAVNFCHEWVRKPSCFN